MFAIIHLIHLNTEKCLSLCSLNNLILLDKNVSNTSSFIQYTDTTMNNVLKEKVNTFQKLFS